MNELKDYLKGKNHIIWDWNGTIINDIDLCVTIVNRMLSSQNLPGVSKDEYRKKFGFPVHDFYHKIGLAPAWTFEQINEFFHGHYHAEVLTVEIFEGAIDFLAELKGSGKHSYILSAAREEDILTLLDHHNLRQFFELVFGLSHSHADSKVQRGLDLLTYAKIPVEEAVLIGDTDHDLEVGTKMGVDVILLGDGHQCHEKLQKLHPKVVVRKPTE